MKLEEITGVVDNTVNVDDPVPGSEGESSSGAVDNGVPGLLIRADRRLALCCDAATMEGDDITPIKSGLVLSIACVSPVSCAAGLSLSSELRGSTKAPADGVGYDMVSMPLEVVELFLMISPISFGGSAKVQAGLVSGIMSFSVFSIGAHAGPAWSSSVDCLSFLADEAGESISFVDFC